MKKGIAICILASISLFIGQAQAAKKDIWNLQCQDQKISATCVIAQDLFLMQKNKEGKQQAVGRLLGLRVFYAENAKHKKAPFLAVETPLGVDLRPGAVLAVDKGSEYHMQYLNCTKRGCSALVELDNLLLKNIKAGKNLRIGFRLWGQAKVSAIDASLMGFSRAFRKLKH